MNINDSSADGESDYLFTLAAEEEERLLLAKQEKLLTQIKYSLDLKGNPLTMLMERFKYELIEQVHHFRMNLINYDQVL